MGQRVAAALDDIGFLAIQLVHECTTAIKHGVAGVDVALTAVGGFQIQAVIGVQLPAEQATDVLVAHAFTTRHQGIGPHLMFTVDVSIIGIGLVGTAIQAEGQAVVERTAEVEVGTLAGPFGIVFRLDRVQGDRATQLLGRPLGDDIHHPTHGPRAIACGGRAAEDFDAFDFFSRHPVGFATGVTVTGPAVTHGVTRAGRTAIDKNQGVFRAHAAQVDLAVVTTTATGAVTGQVDPRLAADHVGEVIGRRTLLDVLSGDDRHTRRLLELLFSGDHGILERDRIGGFGGCTQGIHLGIHHLGGKQRARGKTGRNDGQ